MSNSTPTRLGRLNNDTKGNMGLKAALNQSSKEKKNLLNNNISSSNERDNNFGLKNALSNTSKDNISLNEKKNMALNASTLSTPTIYSNLPPSPQAKKEEKRLPPCEPPLPIKPEDFITVYQ